MVEPFLREDAMSSVEEIKATLSSLGISAFHISAFMRRIAKALSKSFPALNDEQVRFSSLLEKHLSCDVPPTTFEEEVAKANWFIQSDSYIKLCTDVGCIADYIIAASEDYSERLSKEIVRSVKEQVLLPLQKENKGLALVYLANR